MRIERRAWDIAPTLALVVAALALNFFILVVGVRPTAIGLRDMDDIMVTGRIYPDMLIDRRPDSSAPSLDGRRRLSARLHDEHLAFRIVDADTQQAIAGAAVFEILDNDAPAVGRRAPQRVATSDEGGWIRLEDPKRESGQEYSAFDDLFVVLAPGFDPIALDLVETSVIQGMHRSRTVDLRVVDCCGEAIQGAIVRPSWLDSRLVECLDEVTRMNVQRDLVELVSLINEVAIECTTDAEGRVTVPCVDARVGKGGTVERPGFVTATWPPIGPVATFASERTVRMIAGRRFRGRLVDRSGAPLPGFAIGERDNAPTTVTERDGRFDIELSGIMTFIVARYPEITPGQGFHGPFRWHRILCAIAPTDAQRITDLVMDEDDPGDDTTWARDPVRRLAVRVIDESTSADLSARASLKIIRRGEAGFLSIASEEPARRALRLVPGTYRIAAIDYGAQFEDAVVDVVVAPEDTKKEITVSVRKRPQIDVEIANVTSRIEVGVDCAEGRWLVTTNKAGRCRLAVPRQTPYTIVVGVPDDWGLNPAALDGPRARRVPGPAVLPAGVFKIDPTKPREIRGHCVDASGAPVSVYARLVLHGVEEPGHTMNIVGLDSAFELTVDAPVDIDVRADVIISSEDRQPHLLTVDVPAGNGRVVDLGTITLANESPNQIALRLPDGLAADDIDMNLVREDGVDPTWHVSDEHWICLRPFERGQRLKLNGRRVMPLEHALVGPGPVELPFPSGRLTVRVMPLGETQPVSSEWAMTSIEPIVYVDDQPFVASLDAPSPIYGIADGRHTVIVVYRGFESMRMEIEWKNGEERVIDVYLRPKP